MTENRNSTTFTGPMILIGVGGTGIRCIRNILLSLSRVESRHIWNCLMQSYRSIESFIIRRDDSVLTVRSAETFWKAPRLVPLNSMSSKMPVMLSADQRESERVLREEIRRQMKEPCLTKNAIRAGERIRKLMIQCSQTRIPENDLTQTFREYHDRHQITQNQSDHNFKEEFPDHEEKQTISAYLIQRVRTESKPETFRTGSRCKERTGFS